MHAEAKCIYPASSNIQRFWNALVVLQTKGNCSFLKSSGISNLLYINELEIEINSNIYTSKIVIFSEPYKFLHSVLTLFLFRVSILVTELMDCNLYELLHNRNRPTLEFGAKIKLAMDIAEAMAFLHSRNIILRDLNSTNVLLNMDQFVAKVCFHFQSIFLFIPRSLKVSWFF